MNQYVTGAAIKELRERNRLTQAELAERINVSDKAVSRWETGKGYPDITLLEPLARALGASVAELLSGNAIQNTNVSANMYRCKLHVCPVCGNIVQSTGEASISCHGIELQPLEAEAAEAKHAATIQRVEDEYYIQIEHPMTKDHHISFIAALAPDRVQLVKTYPESSAAARFKIDGIREVLFYCNKDGLFQQPVR